MKYVLILISAIVFYSCSGTKKTQNYITDNIFSVIEISKNINYLASDEMKGRKTFSPEIDRAAEFIAADFEKSGLKPLQNNSYFQKFSMINAKQTGMEGAINDMGVNTENTIIVTTQPSLIIKNTDGFKLIQIKATDNFNEAVRTISTTKEKTIIAVNTAFQKNFNRLQFLKRNLTSKTPDLIFVISDNPVDKIDLKVTHEISENKLQNVLGVLPGKSKKNEYVIFSAHYDHIGTTGKNINDSIFNGANDDASGTVAIMALAKHYGKLKNNERTIIFVAFTAEEIGGYGSKYFSETLNSNDVTAMFNIEMIGTDSKWGKNSAYITGFEKSSMGEILQQNLTGSEFKFYPDPYPNQNLFYRSDNATLAALGVPAHTISTSKMDVEPNYHKVSDEVSTLDLNNMTDIIKAIAISAQSIIKGSSTPTRVSAK